MTYYRPTLTFYHLLQANLRNWKHTFYLLNTWAWHSCTVGLVIIFICRTRKSLTQATLSKENYRFPGCLITHRVFYNQMPLNPIIIIITRLDVQQCQAQGLVFRIRMCKTKDYLILLLNEAFLRLICLWLSLLREITISKASFRYRTLTLARKLYENYVKGLRGTWGMHQNHLLPLKPSKSYGWWGGVVAHVIIVSPPVPIGFGF